MNGPDAVSVRTPCSTCGANFLTEIRYDLLHDTYTFRMAHADQYVKQLLSRQASDESPGSGDYVIGLMVEQLARGTHCLEWAEPVLPPTARWATDPSSWLSAGGPA